MPKKREHIGFPKIPGSNKIDRDEVKKLFMQSEFLVFRDFCRSMGVERNKQQTIDYKNWEREKREKFSQPISEAHKVVEKSLKQMIFENTQIAIKDGQAMSMNMLRAANKVSAYLADLPAERIISYGDQLFSLIALADKALTLAHKSTFLDQVDKIEPKLLEPYQDQNKPAGERKLAVTFDIELAHKDKIKMTQQQAQDIIVQAFRFTEARKADTTVEPDNTDESSNT